MVLCAGASNCKHEPFKCSTLCSQAENKKEVLEAEVDEKPLPPRHGLKLGRLHFDDLVDRSKGVVGKYTLSICARVPWRTTLAFALTLSHFTIRTISFLWMALEAQ